MSRLLSTFMITVLLWASLMSSAPTTVAQDDVQEPAIGATPTPGELGTESPEETTSLYLPLIVGGQGGGDAGQSPQESEIVCAIPTGDQGIHYEANPDVPAWGPSALVIGSDQTFWIADAAANRILQFDAACNLVSTISLDGLTTAPTDLAVTEKSLWVLDSSSQQAAVLNLSRQGALIAQYPLPESLNTAAGLSGITVSPQDELLIEQENGAQLHRMLDSNESPVFAATSGYTLGEQSIQVSSGGLASNDPSTGYIKTGSAEISVSVPNALGGLHILGFAPDGSFYAALEEVALRDSIVVDQRVRHYTPDGVLLGETRAPVQAQYTYVPHALAVSADGNVYFLATRPTGVEIQRLHFVVDLAPAIPPLEPVIKADDESGVATPQPFVDPEATSQSSSLRSDNSIQACTITRETIMANANAFINNSTWLSDANINGVCSNRGKPRYLSNPGTYSSVPYDWGGKVSIATFNTKMNQGYQAGDYTNDTPSGQSCSVGVDCSGFIARVWNVPAFDSTCCENVGTSKLTEYSTVLSSVNELQRGDVLNNKTSHVALFDRFGNNGFYSYEATTDQNVDRVHQLFRTWTWVANGSYKPYSLKSQYLCTSDTDDGRSISLNQTLNGTISPNDDLDPYKFNGTKGQMVEIRMTKTSGNLDSYLNLYNTNGNWLTSDDNGGGFPNSLIRWTLPATGMYRIEALSYNRASTGGYQLAIRPGGQPPAAPSNLRATALDSTRIQLNWQDNSNNETRFTIYDGSIFVANVGANTVSYTVTGLAPGSYHCYTLYAYNNYGSSAWTPWACAITPNVSSNLARGRPAYATSQESTTYTPAKGNDGNTSTRWSSQWSATARDEWWWVDLGAQTFDRAIVRWEAAYATQYYICSTNDLAAPCVGYWYTANSAGLYTHNLGTRTARYVAILMRQRAPCCGNYSFWEFEVYRTAALSAAGAENDVVDAVELTPDGDLDAITIPQSAEENTLFLPLIQQ